MFIPAQTPDLHLPLTQMLEAKPVTPVSAVPGVPEDAQHLDSRVALQWAQPVLHGDKSQAARTPLAPKSDAEPAKVLPLHGFEPHGPDPEALRKGEVHPMMAHGLASWLGFSLSKPTQIQRIAVDTSQAQADDVMSVLLDVYRQIADSDLFAAQRLSEAWLPRKSVLQPELSAPKTPEEQAPSQAKPKMPLAKSDSQDVVEKFKSLAQPVAETSMSQLKKWVAAIEPDNEYSQQAAHMLTQGQIIWQANLAPGLPMRIVREDAWRNAANKPAQLEKGAMLKVELTLPNLGRIRIVGSQWGQDLSLQIAHASNMQVQWTSLMPALLQDLQASGISDVRLENLTDDSEASNG
jgi:hypothetical protein